MTSLVPLPIDDVLPELIAALRLDGAAILRAPPGAGKSTRVPGALLDAHLLDPADLAWITQPRRVAARALATRVAHERGTTLGAEVGYQVRFERRASDATRLLFTTEGMLLRQLQRDPLLDGVGAVILDELHERSLDVDLCLAMLAEVRQARPELLLVVMSATLDAAPLAKMLGCQAITSLGRAYPVTTTLAPCGLDARAAGAARAIEDAMMSPDDDGGDALIFMPGTRDILDTMRHLEAPARRLGFEVLPLHGGLTLAEQVRAIEPGTRRRVIVATNIAETSLTVEGVTLVVDSGLVKQLRQTQSGLDRLDTITISQSSAAQRAGRAGRVRPGRAIQLWSDADARAMRPYDLPEVRRVGLSGALLQIAAWRGDDPRGFGWFEPPTEQAIARDEALLRALGALKPGAWGLTPIGQNLLSLPLEPRLGRFLLEGARAGLLDEVARAAALLSEGDARAGAGQALVMCDVWEATQRASRGELPHATRQIQRQLIDLMREVAKPAREDHVGPREDRFRRAIATAWPDRLCVSQRGDADAYIMAGGSPVTLGRESRARGGELMIAVEVSGQRATRGESSGIVARPLVRMATRLSREELGRWLPDLLTTQVEVTFDPSRERVMALRRTRAAGLLLDEQVASTREHAAPMQVAAQLAHAASADLRIALALDDDGEQWLERLAFARAHAPELELPALPAKAPSEGRDEAAQAIITAWCWGKRSFQELRQAQLASLLRSSLTRHQWSALEAIAPERVTIPSGRATRLHYQGADSPVLAARIQDLFGLHQTPRVGQGRVPVTLHLLAPSGRPAQVTQDLASFWTNTYPEVRKELRARYPRHDWPEDPLTAIARQRGDKRSR